MKNTGRGIDRRERTPRDVRPCRAVGTGPARFGYDPAAEAGLVAVEVVNRQRAVAVDVRRVERLVRVLVAGLLGIRAASLGVCLLGDRAMARLNETFLGHTGPTDVITFDYGDPASRGRGRGGHPVGLWGELCIGMEEAIRQARRYGCDWSREVARYIVHGVLHLLGHDDREPAARRRMKRAEDRLLRRLAGTLGTLALGRHG